MIKDILRKIISRKTISKIKLGKDCFYYTKYLKGIESNSKDADFLIGTPIHANLGDHLISVAEYTFLDSIAYSRTVYDIPTEVFLVFSERIKKHIKNDTTIFINGGGWMGNLWPVEELNLQKIVHEFKNNRIIIFPQTIFYDDKVKDCKSLMDSGDSVYNECKNLTICMRDKASYEFAKSHYKNARLVYCPDIALSYRYVGSKNVENKIAFCLRNDRENLSDENQMKSMKLYFKKKKWSCDIISTIANKPVPLYSRDVMVQKKLEQFAGYSLIVTNRLHGMLYAYLTKTPCIVFDNKTRKVSGTYTAWLTECKSILFVDKQIDNSAIGEFIQKVQNSNQDDTSQRGKNFNELKEIVKNG